MLRFTTLKEKMMSEQFTLDSTISISGTAKLLGVSRQNISQRVKRGSIPSGIVNGIPRVPEDWVYQTLAMRNRDKNQNEG
jgi:IS30 family transposase